MLLILKNLFIKVKTKFYESQVYFKATIIGGNVFAFSHEKGSFGNGKIVSGNILRMYLI
jgi:hypothetical protein